MFTVYGPRNDDADVDIKGPMHSYLLLTRSDSTMVLKTDQEINEMEQSGFNVTSATILAANLDSNRLVVQVCPSSVHLLNATTGAILHQLTMTEDFLIQSASALDPYVALLSQRGQIGMITLGPGPSLIFTRMKFEVFVTTVSDILIYHLNILLIYYHLRILTPFACVCIVTLAACLLQLLLIPNAPLQLILLRTRCQR